MKLLPMKPQPPVTRRFIALSRARGFERFDRGADHLGNLGISRLHGRMRDGGEMAQVPRQQKQVTGFLNRSAGGGEELAEFGCRPPSLPLSNGGGNGHGGPAELTGQAMALLRRESLDDVEDGQGGRVSLLPDKQIVPTLSLFYAHGHVGNFINQARCQRLRSRLTASCTSVSRMPTAASLEQSMTQLERGVLAATCMNSSSSLKKTNSFRQTPLCLISSTTSRVVMKPGLVTL